MEPTFERALEQLINHYSKENDSNTPDFVLAAYMQRCLDNWNATMKERAKYYQGEPA